ncbi:PAS domain S-box protein [Tepidimonas charontis]|uniref:Virulence sensor protein BvgS n=1 Tax=Tepidimonas charontis TaxID=2267262 RepID=A0A554XGV9_9BURK|nr:PAS domain S-box protein [Tepidimonas charontis]TSE35067.1 Signal transduction histidine-protein kinase BarA [Tepidimonas charontis]
MLDRVADVETFIGRLRPVLFEVALGLGTTLDEQREIANLLAVIADRLMPLACVLARRGGDGRWIYESRPRRHDWAARWNEWLLGSPLEPGLADAAHTLPVPTAHWSRAADGAASVVAQQPAVHFWPLGEFGVLALHVHRPYPPPALAEMARVLQRFMMALAACREHRRVNELLMAQRLSARVFDLSPQAMLVCDAEQRIVDVNPAFTRITGYARDEAVGRTPRLLSSGVHDEAFFDAMWSAIRHEGHWQGEIWNRRKDGTVYPELLTIVAVPDQAGVVRSYVGIFQDIGEQKEREAELERLRDSLQRSNDYLQSIVDHLGEGIYTLDGEGRCTFFNAAAERLLGWRAEEVLGRKLHDIIHHHRADGAPLAESECPIRRAFIERAIYRSEDEVFWHKDGHPVPVRVVAAPLYRGETLIASVAVFDDVSAQKELEQRLRQAKDAAEAAARLKAEFLAVMSHEIRTPLNGVIGMADLLADTPLSGEQQDYVRTIKHSADHLLALINDILDYSKLEADAVELDWRPVDLGALLDDCVDVVAPRLENRPVVLASRLDPGLPRTLRLDPTRVRQIVLNLLGNAVKFTEQGSIELVAQATDGRLRLMVRDTGPGIAADLLPRLFKPFTQAEAATTRKYGGTGLGLAICKRLAELMGGSIRVESEVGRGSAFIVELPLQPLETSPARDSLAGLRLAVAGAEGTLLAAWQRLLQAWQIDVRYCADAEALGLALQQGVEGVLLVEPGGPEGAALAEQVLVHPRPLLVALPAAGERSARASWLQRGAVAVFVPPLAQSRIHDRLADIFLGGPSTQPAPEAGAHDSLQGLTVLLAEDNTVNQRVAQAMLGKLGYRVVLANDGREAVTQWCQHPVDVILMDCQMPEVDGFAATAEIRRLEAQLGRARVPIVAMTANALEGDREACLAAGMDDYLSKPVTRERLEAVLQRVRPVHPHTMGECDMDDVIDAAALAAATGDDAALARDILQLFDAGLDELLARVRQSASALDTAALFGAAHELKGAAASVGARALAGLAEAIENAARAGRIEAAAVAALEGAAAAFRVRLSGWLQ